MSNNKSAAEQQEEVSKAVSDAPVDTAPASAVNPSPKKPTAEVEAVTGEESRDSVNSVGEDSAEGDEDEEAGDEEETDEEQQGEKAAANGHHGEKNGHQQQTEEGAEAELNGDAKTRKRTSGGPEEPEDVGMKKKRVEDEEPAEPEVPAAAQ